MIGKVIQDTNIGNKNWVSFYDENDKLSLFYGFKTDNPDGLLLEEDEEERKHFVYTSNSIYESEDTGNYYLGEKIVFKTLDNDPVKEEVIKDLFNSISSGLSQGVWTTLREALDDLSKFFSLFGKEDNVIKGYIGEVSIIYEILFNSKFYNRLRLANYLIESYQRTEKKRHDYNFSSRLKVEVKSTSSERNSFKLDYGQQQNIRDESDLVYAFVKYSYSEQKILGWKTLNEMINEIKEYPGIVSNNWNKANHLITISKRYNTSDWRIDPRNIELFLINSKELPTIDIPSNKYISEVKYKFDLDRFMIDKKYSDEEKYNQLLSLFIKNDKGDEDGAR